MSGTLGVTGVLTSTGGITVGVCDTGLDVKFFGASAGAYMLYDQSCDQLEIRGAAADAATSTGKLLLTTALTNINACDVIGSINFQAPLEAGSCDAILVAAGIRAVAQATFTCAVNATDLIFYTGHSEVAAERFRFTSQNEIGVAGDNYGTDGQVLTSGGAGAAVAWEDAGAGALTHQGTATSEVTTTSTSTVDLIDIVGLCVAATVPLLITHSARKGTGASAAVSLGLKINGTVVRGDAADAFNSTNAAEQAYYQYNVGDRVACYPDAGNIQWGNSAKGGCSTSFNGCRPCAAVTTIDVTGTSGSGSVTLGTNGLHVYSFGVA